MNRAVLHIGAPKTGTSIIQSHLSQNRTVLRDMGYLYPITISANERLYRTFESHHLLTYSLADWEPFNGYSPELFIEMAEETAQEYGIHTLLLSAENTYWLPRQIVARELPEESVFWDEKRKYVEKIQRYLSRYDTEIVIYLRRQDRWMESWFNQQTKNGNALTATMDAFIEHHAWLVDYKTTIGIWADAFGQDQVKVRVYEKGQLTDGLFSDYCATVGISDPGKLPLRGLARYNAQLDRDALEFMKICNSLDMDADQKWWLRMKLRKVTKQFESQAVFQNQSLLSPDQRADLVDRFADDNAEIASNYLGREDGRLFKEPNPDRSEKWEPYPGLAPEKMLANVIQLLLELQSEQANVSKGTTQPIDSLPHTDDQRLDDADRAYWKAHLWGQQGA